MLPSSIWCPVRLFLTMLFMDDDLLSLDSLAVAARYWFTIYDAGDLWLDTSVAMVSISLYNRPANVSLK